jgi:hypothetical protein
MTCAPFSLRLAVWLFEDGRRWGPLELRVRSKRGVGDRFGFGFGFGFLGFGVIGKANFGGSFFVEDTTRDLLEFGVLETE